MSLGLNVDFVLNATPTEKKAGPDKPSHSQHVTKPVPSQPWHGFILPRQKNAR